MRTADPVEERKKREAGRPKTKQAGGAGKRLFNRAASKRAQQAFSRRGVRQVRPGKNGNRRQRQAYGDRHGRRLQLKVCGVVVVGGSCAARCGGGHARQGGKVCGPARESSG